MSDIKIARSAKISDISKIAKKLGISKDNLELYGKHKAKISLEPENHPKGKLILVTAINPTPYGEGKTTISVGLADGLSHIGKKTCLALREPSLGPVFGVKGGATGGGYAQVVPMEDINLHFTGDFHAITSANNLLSALIDNHIHQGNELDLDLDRIEWKRCVDLNDRALRQIQCGLGGEKNGIPREDGFQITAASEIMAILCLAKDLSDLKKRLGNIIIGYDKKGSTVRAKALKAENAMAILLKDAIYPNLVQTLEGTPALIHGGPFANIAHGCNSIRATKLAMSIADYTVTEAGFGADLGAEKFLDIKCRVGDISPNVIVLVATVRAIKHNGGNIDGGKEALLSGMVNLQGHIENLTKNFNAKVVVAINKFITDTKEDIEEIKLAAKKYGAQTFVSECWEKGGKGCLELAKWVAKCADDEKAPLNYAYPLDEDIDKKITAIATKVYGAGSVVFSPLAKEKIGLLNKSPEFRKLPVCIAKTQYSFSDNPLLLGRPKGFEFLVRDILVRAGSGFIVAVSGNILLMPGLSKSPAATNMTIDEGGSIEGLF